ncbi:MAG: pyridoxal phosphate-dependent decarboxylase family protein [Acidimicrobiia bacterium]
MTGGPDPARIDGMDEALARLAPALEAFAARAPEGPVPAFEAPLEPLPAAGVGADAVLDELAAHVATGCRIGMPGWLGFITTAPTTVAVAATAAASVAGAQRYLHHSFNHLEHQALAWLAELCRIPSSAAGVFTSGGSTANLVALGAARQRAFERRGHDVAEHGLPPSPARIYCSERAHRTVHRSAGVLGLGRASVRAVDSDASGHVDAAALERAIVEDLADGILPIAVVAVAGSTDTGSVDDIGRLAELCGRHDVWLHVDGAYGLVAQACPELAPRFDGIDQADSWIVDPHKWLVTGTGIGAAYVADGALLTRAFAEGAAPYLEGSFSTHGEVVRSQFDGFAGGWADQGVELSSPSRGAVVWAVLREIGRDGVVARVRRDVALAADLVRRVREEPELELLDEPDLSIVCFRYRPAGDDRRAELDQLNAGIARALRHETNTVPTSTVVGGRFALRACFINPRTTEHEVEALVASVLRFGRSLAG